MADVRCLALFGALAVGLVLSACATPGVEPEEPQAPSISRDAAIGSSLRAAAVASQEARNYAAAVGYYNSLYQRNRDDAAAALGLARNLRFLGDVSQAATIVEDFLARHPDEPALTAEHGKVLLAQGKTGEAAPVLSRAAELAPDDWQVRSALGIVYDLMDDHEAAVSAYESALAIRPESPTVLNNLALSHAMAGDVDAGINLLRRADQQTGASAQIRQNLALLLAMKGSLGEAERLVRADLPKEMADANMEVLARIAAKGGAATAADLARLTTIQNVPRSEPIDVAAAEPAGEVVVAPEAGEGDLAAAASAAADEAMAALLAEPEPEASAVATAAGAYRVQLASFRTEAEATRERATLLARFPDLLDGDALAVRSVTLATGETVWRLYAGPFAERGPADDLCRSLAERSASCLVTAGGG